MRIYVKLSRQIPRSVRTCKLDASYLIQVEHPTSWCVRDSPLIPPRSRGFIRLDDITVRDYQREILKDDTILSPKLAQLSSRLKV